ncbi:MAG: FCSD flavin-binding domain-containing protein [Gammaproteobacteria bacterium]|nr:FCSD flavin-binding domain-containing protein [Gammaproteobacteria bacterium]
MKKITRRSFNTMLGVAGAATALGGCAGMLPGSGKGRVVVVGGGFGGATATKYIRKMDSEVEVVLIEPKREFFTCPFSNTVIGGLNEMDYIKQNYDALRDKWGATVVHDTVTGVDTAKKTVWTETGHTFSYDKLVLSPGIDFKWDAVPGYSEAAAQRAPHAWNGGDQTVLLRDQLRAMRDGGVCIIVSPPNPFRCPPGPYERASLIANYFKTWKPKSKVIILDAKPQFSKMPLFQEGWKELYGTMIEWVGQQDGAVATRIDVSTMTVHTEFDKFKGDVINFIPHQKAAAIAHAAGVANESGWCPIDARTFESTLAKDVYVLGDSSIADPMPKSGFSASSQGKTCAIAIVAELSGKEPPVPSYINTCYSLVAPGYGISVAAVYGYADGKMHSVKGAGGVSPKAASAEFRREEASYAEGWYASISSDIWG